MARHNQSSGKQRTESITIRVYPEEKEKVMRFAEVLELSYSKLIMDAFNECYPGDTLHESGLTDSHIKNARTFKKSP